MAFEDLLKSSIEERQQEEDILETLRKKKDEEDLFSSLNPEKPGKSILEQQLTTETAGLIARGLLTSADEALIREGQKGGAQIFLDTMMVLPRAVKAAATGFAETVTENIQDPVKAIPVVTSTLLGIAGGATGNPALAIGGAYLGRGLGRYMLSKIEGRDFGTVGDYLDVGLGGVTSAATLPIGGAVRSALRKAGAVSGSGVGLGLVETIVKRSPVLKEGDPAGAKAAALIQQAAEAAQVKRDKVYADSKRMRLMMKYPDRDLKSVVLDPDIPTRDKTAFAEEWKSLEEDKRAVQTFIERRGGEEGPPLSPSERTKYLLEVKHERRALKNALVVKPVTLKSLPEETKAGTQRRFVEFAEREEKSRIGSQAWRNSLNEYANQDLDALRSVVAYTPEVLDNPLIKEIEGRVALAPMFFDTQVGFHRNGDPLFQQIGNILLHSSETVRTVTHSVKESARALIDKHKVNMEHMLHLSSLQNKGEIVQAWDEAKTSWLKRLENADPEKVKSFNLDAALRFELDVINKRYKYNVSEGELDTQLQALKFLDDWRQQVTDPVYGVAHFMNADPAYLAPFSPTYFLPTTAHKRDLATISSQKGMVQQLLNGIDDSTVDGRMEKKRLQDIIDSFARKEKIAQTAHDAAELEVSNIHKMIEEKGVRYVLSKHGSFLPKGKRSKLSIDLDVAKGAEDYIDRFVGKAVYDQALPAAWQTLRKFKEKNIATRPEDTKRAAAWAQNVLLDQLGARRNAKLENMRRAMSNSTIPGLADNVGKAISTLSQAHYVLNVAMKPRFYGLQVLQNVLALAPQVDTESLWHGIATSLFDRKSWDEARKAGVISEGAHRVDQYSLLNEDVFSGQRSEGLVGKVLNGMGYLAEKSEQWNRVISYNAGLRHAELNGLTGDAAHRKALDVVKDSHFLYDAANRPVITNTPVGSLMFRYRTFSQNYASFLAHRFRDKDPSRIAASLGALLATAGTNGIPLYSMVRYELAKQGVEIPEVHPLDETLGIDMGGAESPIPSYPTSPSELLGPFWDQAQEVYDTMNEEAPLSARLGAAAGVVAGGPFRQAVGSVQERLNRGVTASPQGEEVKSVRSERDIALSGIGLKPSTRGLQAEAYRRLSKALRTKNTDFVRKEREVLQKKGVTNTQEILTRLVTQQKTGSRLSAIEILTRSPSR